LVHGRHALAGVDDEQRDVALVDGQFGLDAHPRLEALVRDVLEAGGVDQLQVQIAEAAGSESPVAGDARPIVAEGELAARQPVEQGGLTDVRTPDDRKFQRHGVLSYPCDQRRAMSWASSVTT